jgi:hypothetical protein
MDPTPIRIRKAKKCLIRIRILNRLKGTYGNVRAGVHGEPLPVRDDALLQHGGCSLQPRLSVSSLRELPSPRAQVPTLRLGTSRIQREGNSSQSWVENTNMTDCISSFLADDTFSFGVFTVNYCMIRVIFEFFRKFTEIFASQGATLLSTTTGVVHREM